jgi:glucokinase
VTDPRRVALGFDFGGTKCAIAVGTKDGEVLAEDRLAATAYARPEALVEQAVLRGKELSRGWELVAVGVSTMGITRDDGVLLAPNVPGWERLRLPETFRGHFPAVPVRIGNDVKAAHQAEVRWGALQDAASSAYLNLGTGVALSFAVGGRVVAGAHGGAGEIAYAWRPDEVGARAGRAPLEERLGGAALDRELRIRFQVLSLADAFRVWTTREDVAGFLRERFGELSWWIGQALLVLDVEALAVGGGVSRALPVFQPWWEASFREHLPFPPPVRPAHFLDRTGMMGALSLAWEDRL